MHRNLTRWLTIWLHIYITAPPSESLRLYIYSLAIRNRYVTSSSFLSSFKVLLMICSWKIWNLSSHSYSNALSNSSVIFINDISFFGVAADLIIYKSNLIILELSSLSSASRCYYVPSRSLFGLLVCDDVHPIYLNLFIH